jgi:hypothetical protein
MHAVSEAPLEAISIEQSHEELEILLLAVVRCGREEEEVPSEGRQQLSKTGTVWCS